GSAEFLTNYLFNQLQQNTTTKTQINTVFTVTASDSIEDKSRLLNIDGCLKLSLLGGLVNVGGAANFLKDTKKSFSQQRLTLHYHSTTKFEELIMNHFSSGEMAHYDNDVATHVVTAVLYGADVCFVFDREVSSDEDKMEIAGEVKAALEQLKGISSASIDASMKLNDIQKAAVHKFSCKFYGDFQLPRNPTSFEDAMKVFKDLPKLLGENKEHAVPLRVWLYPLDKLFSRVVKFQHEISTGLSTDIESVIESLSTNEMKCSDLLTDMTALTFTAFHDKINDMKKNCYQCRLSLIKKLGSLLPKIRGKFIEDTALIDLLNDHEDSPFERNSLEQWLKEKEEESDIMKTLLAQLNDQGVMVEINLNKNLMNLEVKHLVSYTFTSLGWPDVLLSKQKTYLSSTKRTNEEKSFESEHKTWLTPDIQKTMRNNLKVFKNLIGLNSSEPVKFIVASKEMENNPGSCILLYENESNEAVCFTPPSKPDCPIIEDVRCRQVVLKVSPPCPATEELKLLYKMKEEKDWISQTVSKNQNRFLQQLMCLGAEVNRSLDSYLSDIQVENVFCYTFSSLEQPDELLSEQENDMNPQIMRNPKKTHDASQSWLTGSVREKMREHLKIFKELMTSHSNQSIKFMISIKDHEKHPGSCILVYENGCNEAVCFTPPSKPDCPITEDVRSRQADLKVSSPCPATEELKILYKMKEEKDWRSQTVSKDQNTVTLTDLRPDTEYQIKCAAVGKLNYTTESDVTSVIAKV
uniref:Fibronectin type-III domain-containing protein n=1 Tax=Sinocyclocheilus anshuiensis TaxID=1608454 RepID=A0A671K6N6_9TELE